MTELIEKSIDDENDFYFQVKGKSLQLILIRICQCKAKLHFDASFIRF